MFVSSKLHTTLRAKETPLQLQFQLLVFIAFTFSINVLIDGKVKNSFVIDNSYSFACVEILINSTTDPMVCRRA
jgi:sensor histidine kinase YesM